MGHAFEREHVMPTERVERDVSSQDQLLVALVVGEGREIEGAGRKHLRVRRGDTAGSVAGVLVFDVLAERGQELGDGALGASEIHIGAAADELETRCAAGLGGGFCDGHAASPPWQVSKLNVWPCSDRNRSGWARRGPPSSSHRSVAVRARSTRRAPWRKSVELTESGHSGG